MLDSLSDLPLKSESVVIIAWVIRECLGLIGRVVLGRTEDQEIKALVKSVDSLVGKMDLLANRLADLVIELHKVKIDVESIKAH